MIDNNPLTSLTSLSSQHYVNIPRHDVIIIIIFSVPSTTSSNTLFFLKVWDNADVLDHCSMHLFFHYQIELQNIVSISMHIRKYRKETKRRQRHLMVRRSFDTLSQTIFRQSVSVTWTVNNEQGTIFALFHHVDLSAIGSFATATAATVTHFSSKNYW